MLRRPAGGITIALQCWEADRSSRELRGRPGGTALEGARQVGLCGPPVADGRDEVLRGWLGG